jgi:Tol biopolymer transport system component
MKRSCWTSAHAALVAALTAAACSGSRAAAPEKAGESGFVLVYERTVNGNQDLYIIPAGGGIERRLTDDPGVDALPRWSRDGKSILFASDRTGDWQLYSVSPEGGKARRLRTNGGSEQQIDGSPDGRTVAFLAQKDGPKSPQWLLTADPGSGEERVWVKHGADSILGNPTFDPAGKRIVFSSNVRVGHQIYVLDLATGKEERLSPIHKGGCEPRFSRDGRKVLYVSRGHLRPRSRIVEHDLATGEEKVLVDWPALNYTPVYSPDGSEVAFTSNITGDWVIYRQRLSDGKAWRVTFGPGPARAPDYRPVG